MRGFASYLVAGILVVLALDFIAPPVGLGLALGAWPAVDHTSVVVQSVNRTHKTDRLLVPTTTVGKQRPAKPRPIMVGCDPVFSPLSASARANFSGRCIV